MLVNFAFSFCFLELKFEAENCYGSFSNDLLVTIESNATQKLKVQVKLEKLEYHAKVHFFE